MLYIFNNRRESNYDPQGVEHCRQFPGTRHIYARDDASPSGMLERPPENVARIQSCPKVTIFQSLFVHEKVMVIIRVFSHEVGHGVGDGVGDGVGHGLVYTCQRVSRIAHSLKF